jgi:hypothetical protein
VISSALSSRKPGYRLKRGICEVIVMRIAVFGATGDIGRSVSEEALAQGYEVTALF